MTAAAAPYKKVGSTQAKRSDPAPARIPRALAVWLVVRLAWMLKGGYELGVNDGPLVRLFHRVTGTQAGDAWCAAFTSFLLFLLGRTCPLEPMAYCPNLANWGERQNVSDRTPQVGDLLLFWRYVAGEKRWRFAHVALIVAAHADGTVATLEGNTDDDGGREGWVIAEKSRTIGERDRCIHWHLLIPE